HGATRKEVQEAQTKLLREVDTGTALDPTKITVGEYLDHWLETSIRPNKAILTYEKHEGTIRNHLVPAFGSLPLRKLSSLHVARLYADMQAKGYAPNTIRGTHGCLHAALDRARKWRLIAENPADLDEDAPRADKTPSFIWDAETLARFLELIAGRRFEPHY